MIWANRDERRTPFAVYSENAAITQYKNIVMNMLHLSFPLLSEMELAAAIDDSISRHLKDTPIQLDNNYKKKRIDNTLLAMTDYIITRQPITTPYGVMFSRHGTVPNPLNEMLSRFLSDRNLMKKEMFKYPKGSENFEKYNLLQLLLKIDANG